MDSGIGLNFIIGENGIGKTNLLDAIHFCCMTKSYFHNSDKLNIQHEKDFFRIESKWINNSNEVDEVVVKCKKDSTREILWNQDVYNKASEHIGKIPVVMIIPDEVYTFVSESEERRRFLNYSLIQTDKNYLLQLNIYNQQLKQRITLLKSGGLSHSNNDPLLEAYELDMAKSSIYIRKRRNEFVDNINPLIQEYSQLMSNDKQTSCIKYSSNVKEADIIQQLKEDRQVDALTGRTRTGIHRDKLECYFNNQNLKSFGSQGQIKTFVISLRLAQMNYLTQHSSTSPILLLDDLFAKLDEDRVGQLLQLIEQSSIQQCFISDTHLDRAVHITKNIKIPYRIHQLKNSQIQIYEKK